MPGAEAGAARTCTSEGASGSIPSRWRRSTTLTDPARGGPGADERGREDSEDRSEAAMAAELALGRSGAVAIPTRQRASSRWGTGEGRWIGGPNGIKSPAACRPGDGEACMTARRFMPDRQAMWGAGDVAGGVRSHSRGELRGVPAVRGAPHAVGAGGESSPPAIGSSKGGICAPPWPARGKRGHDMKEILC